MELNTSQQIDNTEDLPLLLQEVIDKLEDLKIEDIKNYDLSKKPNTYTKNVIVATANSFTHLKTATEHIKLFLKKKNLTTLDHLEKVMQPSWLVLDYIEFVVHLFLADTRDHYNLDQLLAETDLKKIEKTQSQVYDLKN